MKKTAVIFGIAGQTGSYLAEHLLNNDYNVFGMVRRNSTPEHQENRIAHLEDKIETFYGDLHDSGSIMKLLSLVKPDEIYNLAAQSHVRISFDVQQLTAQSNALGVLNILECYKEICPKAKFLQASSSEMYGNSIDEDGFQREVTKMLPVSPYGCAKLYAYHIVRTYRKSYNLFACNSICFNHESPRRGSNFVTSKVIKAAVRIKLGFQDKLELGNLDSFRDWGHAKDYAKAQFMIINHKIPDDFVVATGETRSVRQLCEYVFSKLGMNYEDHIIINEKFIRPKELKYLKGDSTKIRQTLNWKPTYTFEELIDEMIDFWLDFYKK